MKILLDLNHSLNNYHWKDKEELNEYVIDMLEILWKWYDETIRDDYEDTEEKSRFYDILDMFTGYKIIESSDENERI